jgi:large subunit ribosomal protein L27
VSSVVNILFWRTIMSHKKAQGSSRNGRDSNAQRLGIKVFAGQAIHPGGIIVRQRGTKYMPGLNVKRGSDDTLFAMKEGKVKFMTDRRGKKVIAVL